MPIARTPPRASTQLDRGWRACCAETCRLPIIVVHARKGITTEPRATRLSHVGDSLAGGRPQVDRQHFPGAAVGSKKPSPGLDGTQHHGVSKTATPGYSDSSR